MTYINMKADLSQEVVNTNTKKNWTNHVEKICRIPRHLQLASYCVHLTCSAWKSLAVVSDEMMFIWKSANCEGSIVGTSESPKLCLKAPTTAPHASERIIPRRSIAGLRVSTDLVVLRSLIIDFTRNTKQMRFKNMPMTDMKVCRSPEVVNTNTKNKGKTRQTMSRKYGPSQPQSKTPTVHLEEKSLRPGGGGRNHTKPSEDFRK